MMKTTKYSLLMAGLAIILVTSCKKDKEPPTAPVVTTAALTNITTTSATAGGTITGNGGANITASGIVWSKANNTPTITDSVAASGTTAGSFIVNLSNLDFNTTYYLRAFATNSVGTSYGSVVTLSTTNDTSKIRFTYNGQNVTYGIIISSVTGKKWMDRNLGATGVATSLTDTVGYGHFFQWGRLADGHQIISSGTISTLSTTDVPGHSNFIITTSNPNRDWRSPSNNNLWQGSSGINNPCPNGWHVPTKTEMEAESITDIPTAYTRLKMTLPGYRSYLAPTVASGKGTQAMYWTSTVDPTQTDNGTSGVLGIGNGTASVSTLRKGNAGSIRCIKD